jgi:bestrophin-3
LQSLFKQLIAAMEKKANQRSFWMPLVWAGSIVIRARKENRVKNDQTVQALITQINDFRNKAGKLLHYDWVPVPLVYTQVLITFPCNVYFFLNVLTKHLISHYVIGKSNMF